LKIIPKPKHLFIVEKTTAKHFPFALFLCIVHDTDITNKLSNQN